MLAKIASFIALRKSSSINGQLLQQLLTSAGTVISVSLIIAFISSVLISGVVYLAFNLLLQYGLSENSAMFVLGFFLILVLVILAFVIINYVHRIKVLAARVALSENPIARHAGNIIDSFMDGFHNSRRP